MPASVTAPGEPLDLDVEAAPLEALHADLLQARIPPGSRRRLRAVSRAGKLAGWFGEHGG